MPVATSHKRATGSTVAKKAARNAMLKVAGTTKVSPTQLERVVQSVNDATKRLSQPDSILSTSTTTKSSKRKSRDTVGPWKLGKTLGKGSSGRVRLAKNMETGQLAAIKIVPKKNNVLGKNDACSTSSASYTSNSSQTSTMMNTTANNYTTAGHSNVATNPYGIEREIVIMKLISHANVLGLYEVWENKSELYLVLEYVDGGELFDYLVSRGRLCEREAVHYFKQIIQGVSYCHAFNICHRDLKPENLLLDKKNSTIKIADFGMAALEVSNKLLQTSCGSPHYASPEIVMGKQYHGGPSDVWSCGIILFALLTGHLPFNDDSIKKLLLKVQSGKYQMPQNLSKEAQDLIAKILTVNPAKRLTTEEILRHPLIVKYDSMMKTKKYKALYKNMGQGKSNADLHLLNNYEATTINLNSRKDIDDTILSNLQILWHGASRELIVAKLLQPRMSEEKVFYSLLLKYKENHSSHPSAEVQAEEAAIAEEHPNESRDFNNEEDNDAGAPKLLQKSQFSVPAIKLEEAGVPSLPSNSIPPAIPVFAASSSRVFKKSGSTLSLQTQKSQRVSLPKSTSGKSLSRSSSRKTLQNSASKRSLYSLNSISKKSLNLNDYVTVGSGNEEFNQLPPLPSLESTNGFENLCEQILFGNALDKILEEEEEEDKCNDLSGFKGTTSSSDVTLTKEAVDKEYTPSEVSIKPAFELNKQKSQRSLEPSDHQKSTVQMPLRDITNNHQPLKNRRSQLKREASQKSNLSAILDQRPIKKEYPPPSNFGMRSSSNAQAQERVHSLDPRRNASQPANSNMVESLLNSFRSKSDSLKRNKSRDWAYSRGSIFLSTRDSTSDTSTSRNESTVKDIAEQTSPSENVLDFDNSALDILAHSSTVHNDNDKESISNITFNASTTFKDLNEILRDGNESYVLNGKRPSQPTTRTNTIRKPSTKLSLTPKSALTVGLSDKKTHSHNCSVMSNDFDLMSDMSFAMDIPTNTFMAQAISISNRASGDHVASDGDYSSKAFAQDERTNTSSHTPATTYEENKVNIFEDAPADSESIDITSSESDSSPNVHRKAVSIDTLNTTNVLPPTTNVRVSLYNNHNSTAGLPRETTEQIISKFNLTPEKPTAPFLQKRFSMIPGNKGLEAPGKSESMLAMFKDLEEDNECDETSESKIHVSSTNNGVDNQGEPQPNRVTMLFDGEEAENEPKSTEPPAHDEEFVLTHKKETAPQSSLGTAKKPKPAIRVRTANPEVSNKSSRPKRNWFSRLFNGFKPKSGGDKLTGYHKTFMPFDDVHLLALHEFDRNAIDYQLKASERRQGKEKVEYDCKFVTGNFKFKIKIESGAGTTLTIRRKVGNKGEASEKAFETFNQNIAEVIKQAESKKQAC